MKKSCFACFLSVAFGCAMARADVLEIVLDEPSQTGSPGDTLQFFGTLTNASADTIFLTGDTLTLPGFPQGSIVDLFGNTPISLSQGANSGDIELFDITIPNGFPGSGNHGNYTLLGGAESEQNIVGTADFTVNVPGISSVPEPSFRILLALGLALFTTVRWMAARRGRPTTLNFAGLQSIERSHSRQRRVGTRFSGASRQRSRLGEAIVVNDELTNASWDCWSTPRSGGGHL